MSKTLITTPDDSSHRVHGRPTKLHRGFWGREPGTGNPEIRVELALIGKNSKQHFAALKNDYDQGHTEGAVGLGLRWHNPTDKNQCRVYVRRDGDFLERNNWDELHRWLKKNLETFHKVFAERVNDFHD